MIFRTPALSAFLLRPGLRLGLGAALAATAAVAVRGDDVIGVRPDQTPVLASELFAYRLDLSHVVIFEGATLSDTDFTRHILKGTRFGKARLARCRFQGDLSSTRLDEAMDLAGVTVEPGSILRREDFDHFSKHGVNLHGVVCAATPEDSAEADGDAGEVEAKATVQDGSGWSSSSSSSSRRAAAGGP